jgi:hypothetical protein
MLTIKLRLTIEYYQMYWNLHVQHFQKKQFVLHQYQWCCCYPQIYFTNHFFNYLDFEMIFFSFILASSFFLIALIHRIILEKFISFRKNWQYK